MEKLFDFGSVHVQFRGNRRRTLRSVIDQEGSTLSEAFRVLRLGGRLAISDIVVDGDLAGLPVSEAQIRSALSWAGCVAGALTASQYRALLAEAGFVSIDVEVRQRYTAEDLLSDTPDALASLDPEVMGELVGRFTSSAIRRGGHNRNADLRDALSVTATNKERPTTEAWRWSFVIRRSSDYSMPR